MCIGDFLAIAKNDQSISQRMFVQNILWALQK